MNLRFGSAIAVLLFLAAVSNSVMDVLQFRYSASVFAKPPFQQQFCNPQLSWKNKWKNGNPAEGESFLGSSTIWVFTTDAWHLAQFCMFTFFELIVVVTYYWWKTPKLYVSVLQFIMLKIFFGLTFELFFTAVLIG